METIKVNMTPCEDIKTIHASQNDNEAREWGFELHNNGEKIDSSSISDQMVFKAYEGGTEEILPTNGSTPTTSPFVGDIKYPQGLLSDQEFLYRESPTEEDGYAKIETIYGNTLVWNQLVQNGNFADDSVWSHIRGTLTVQNNVGTYEVTEVGTSNSTNRIAQSVPIKANHKYAFIGSIMGSKDGMRIIVSKETTAQYFVPSTLLASANTWYKIFGVGTVTTDGTVVAIRYTNVYTIGEVGDKLYFKNLMFFDLTQMGIDSLTDTEVEQWFTSLFSLPYYAYNQGSLLSFMGNGIKTVGKNLASGISQGAVDIHGGTTSNEKRLRVDGFVRVFQGDHYTFTATSNSGKTLQIYTRYFADANGSEQVSYLDWLNLPRSVIIPSGVNYATFTIRFGNNDNITLNDVSDVQIEHGALATSYEPYTSSTLSLPISTYFPNGMKSAGNVYDELTENKAITRIGSVDLGTLTYVREAPSSAHPDWPLFYASVPNALGKYGVYGNTQICAKYSNRASNTWQDKTIGFGAASTNINIADSAFADYTVDQVKQALSGVMLFYQFAIPTETSFTTASLVTENAEIPLSNEDGVLIGKCTEQLSSESGFFDAKIKLADEDGECYSNKIQLHIERSPQ